MESLLSSTPETFSPASTSSNVPVHQAGPSRPRKRRAHDADDVKVDRALQACNRCKAKKLKCRKASDNPSVCISCHKASESCVFEINGISSLGGLRYVSALEQRIAELESALARVDPTHPSVEDHLGTQRSGQALPSLDTIDVTMESTPGLMDTTDLSSLDFELPLLPTVSEEPTPRPVTRDPFGLPSLISAHVNSPQSRLIHPVDPSTVVQPHTTSPLEVNPNPPLPPWNVAEKIVQGLYRHVQARYPFMDWDQLKRWHSRREEICFCPTALNSNTPLDNQIGAFFVWAVYAAGVESGSREPNVESPESYFAQASKYMDAVIGSYDLVTVRALLLVLFYSFRSRNGPPLWLINGFAMRLCVQLGLHRKATTNTDPSLIEVRKRLFWSAYAFDRVICFSTDRPFSISDRNIDIELPADVDDDMANLLRTPGPLKWPPNNPNLTCMSSAIHQIKLYRLRSRLHTAFFAIGAATPSEEDTKAFLAELDEWRRGIPEGDSSQYPVQPVNKMKMAYLQSVLYTLRPSLVAIGPLDARLALCATAAAEACELSKSLLRGTTSKHTIMSVYHIFLCGLTLLYCLNIVPNVISSRVASRAIRSCSSTLAMYSQMFPAALPFCDLFDNIADEVLDPFSRASNDSSRTKNIFATAMGRVLMGQYDQLALVHDALKARHSHQDGGHAAPAYSPTPQQTQLHTVLAAHAPSQSMPPPISEMSQPNETLIPTSADFDTALLQNIGDLSAYLDFPLDTEMGWQD